MVWNGWCHSWRGKHALFAIAKNDMLDSMGGDGCIKIMYTQDIKCRMMNLPGAKSCQEEEPYREAVVVAEGPFQVGIDYCCRVLPAAALGA